MIKIFLVLNLVFLIGCSGAPKKVEAKSKNASATTAVKTEKEELILYVTASKEGLAAADCPKSDGWKSLGWQRLLKAGRACYVHKETFRLQEIGYHLSERDSNLPWGPYFLSLVQEIKGSYSSALWYVELAKKKAAKEPLIEYQRARLLYLSGAKEDAVLAIERLVKNHPDMLEASFFIGQVYASSGRYEDAVTYLRKYLTARPQDTEALLGVARSYDESGKFDLALPVYQKLVFIDQSNWQARLRIAQLNEKLNDNKSIALASYENLMNFIVSNKSKMNLPTNVKIDVETKIREIKEELGQKVTLKSAERQPSAKSVVKK